MEVNENRESVQIIHKVIVIFIFPKIMKLPLPGNSWLLTVLTYSSTQVVTLVQYVVMEIYSK